MPQEADLAEIFALAAPGCATLAGLGERLSALWQSGRAAWPAVDLDAVAFTRHLAERAQSAAQAAGPRAAANPGALPAQAAGSADYLQKVHAADLYLACAAQRALPAALAQLDRMLGAQMPAFLRRLRASPAFADEVKQALIDKLLVAEGGAAPRIAGYSGSGPLLGWLRVAAVRTALNMQRGKREAPLDAAGAAGAMAAGDAETEYLRARYGEAMQTALREAFALLPARQRSVLRLRFAEGLTDEKIAAVYGVHQTTVTRWAAAARETVLRETRRRLGEQLRVEAAELESLAGVLRSRLDISLTGLLGPAAPL